jgi:hypothetical protein
MAVAVVTTSTDNWERTVDVQRRSLSIPANERDSRTPARGAGELSVLGPGADPHH